MDPDRARELLTGELSELDDQMRAAEKNRAEVSADTQGAEAALGQHPGDYAADVNTTMEAKLTVDTVAEQRRRVVDALERLDGGDYGRCVVCSTRIDDERLEARPEVRTCRDHADTPIVT